MCSVQNSHNELWVKIAAVFLEQIKQALVAKAEYITISLWKHKKEISKCHYNTIQTTSTSS